MPGKLKWTYDACYQEAKKYKSLNNFKSEGRGAYNRARIEGWLKDYDWLENLRDKYTFEECERVAKNYRSRKEFKEAHSALFAAADRKGWLKRIKFEIEKKVYSVDYVLSICRECKIKSVVSKEYPGVYGAYLKFKRKGIISDDEIGWKRGMKRGDGDPEAKKHFVYAYDFGNKTVYVGRTTDPRRRDLRHRKSQRNHGVTKAQTVLKYSQDSGIPIPEMYILESGLNMQESCRQEAYWVEKYKLQGYDILNTGVVGEYTGSVGSYAYKWTTESMIEYAKQFDKPSDLIKANEHVEKTLRKLGLIKEIFPNMQTHNDVTYEIAQSAASECKSRGDFAKKYRKFYDVARSKCWLDDFFPKH